MFISKISKYDFLKKLYINTHLRKGNGRWFQREKKIINGELDIYRNLMSQRKAWYDLCSSRDAFGSLCLLTLQSPAKQMGESMWKTDEQVFFFLLFRKIRTYGKSLTPNGTELPSLSTFVPKRPYGYMWLAKVSLNLLCLFHLDYSQYTQCSTLHYSCANWRK